MLFLKQKRALKKIKVGIVGCGAIGSQLARAIEERFGKQATVAYLYDSQKKKAQALQASLRDPVEIVSTPELVKKADLIIEAASQHCATKIIHLVGSQEKVVLIMSVGGVLRARRVSLETFESSKARFWIPSGAIAGIDGLLAAKEGGIISVKLVTKKPPHSLKNTPYFQKRKFPVLKGKKACCIFKGTADQAVRAFPQNINVAAILSFAGIGAKKTQVELWTSNAFKKNQHEISIQYQTGTIHITAQNDPLPENPKTSALAVYAAVATLRRIFSSFRVGT